ncbi:hypothetical protein CNR22_22665 [Sphingobacteriaceae bacterium]|nr:hypothetical protein CNR22_22665 [Sphingobacteriaceae bacterium]
MKSTQIKLGLLTIALAPFLMACPKARHPAAPVADSEVQSSVDVSFANFVATDIDMICAFVAEADLDPDFYNLAPGENPVGIDVDRNLVTDQVTVGYNSGKCRDGVLRDGTIFMYNPHTNPNAKYYRDYEFRGNVILDHYYVNGWAVSIPAGKTFQIYNNLTKPSYDPSKTTLSWRIEGSLLLEHPTDASKNILWEGKLIKTLKNSTDNSVFHTSTQQPINWSKGVVEYRGSVTGLTSTDVPYTLEINSEKPLVRDFSCFADVIGGVESVQPFRTWNKEFHPVKSGVATFKTGDKYPRQIYYGNEGNPGLPAQCDNSGEVLIKGNSYSVNFQ